MKLASVRYQGEPRVVGEHLGERFLLSPTTMQQALASGGCTDFRPLIETPLDPSADLDFLPAVPAPSKIICVGHNYRAHIQELGHDLPEFPNIFNKLTPALIGSHDRVRLSSAATSWDWEAELAFVVGEEVPQGTTGAVGAIAGYTVANDISARDWQKRSSQWLLGKTFASTTPLGPWIVSSDEFDPSEPHRIRCTVDGVERQSSVTSDLLFTPAFLIDYLASVLPLSPGDVVLTGTPGGVGMAMDPPTFLAAGQEVVTSIDGLGECRNTCISTD